MKLNPSLVALVAAVFVAGGYFAYSKFNGNPLPEDIAYGNGRIEAVEVEISSKVAGRVAEVTVKEGDLVQKDARLASIDRRTLEAQLAQAKAELAAQESQVASAEATIAQTEALLLLSQQELARTQELLAKGHTTQEQLDVRVSDQKVAEANVTAAKAALLSAQRSVDAAAAAVDAVQSNLDDTDLTSPTIGRVLYRLAEPGEVVASGGSVLTIVDLSEVYLEFFLPASQAHRVAIGSDARIKLDVLKGTIPANVTFVSPVSQFTPKQVETTDEREKLMFRIKVRIPEELIKNYLEYVKTGVRGVAYVRLYSETPSDWPKSLALVDIPALTDATQ